MASKKSKRQDAVTITINQPAPGAPAKLLANAELSFSYRRRKDAQAAEPPCRSGSTGFAMWNPNPASKRRARGHLSRYNAHLLLQGIPPRSPVGGSGPPATSGRLVRCDLGTRT
jgi:hypothetical protein